MEGVTNGVADYCPQRRRDGAFRRRELRWLDGVRRVGPRAGAMEEMDRYEGFWLSPTGNRVCFEQVDETDVKLINIPRPGDAADPGAAEEHRYPFSGATNPSVKLGVVGVSGGDVAWLDLTKAGLGEDTYLARVYWASDATVLACVQSRDQRTMRLVAYDIDKGESRVVLEETNKAWLNLNDCLRWGVVENEVLIASERDGVQHLYVHGTGDGKVVRRLTEGTDCVVEDLVDIQNGLVYYLGGDVEPAKCTERHLFSVPYDGSSPPKRVDDATGVYLDATAVSKSGAVFLQHSAVDAPVVAELRSTSTTILKDASDAELVSTLKPPEFFEIPSTDGATTLRGAYYAPDAAKYGPGPWPTVVSCYGGPHVQFVADKYATMTGDLRAQHLRERGYLVIKVDNRGSKRRGLAFEAAVQNKFGCLEVDDQVAAVEWAVLCGKADPTRVGIFGWSYGGYLSAMCLAKAPMVFRCAVAGAPVAAWDGYDTHYTERYMGTPSSNPEGYKEGDVCTHVANVEGALLLVHGLVDENVHFRHTARIAQAMVDAGKAYDLLCFPNERHSPRSEKDRAYQEERVFAFLETWLK